MTTLVTGAGGFLGSHVVARLVEEGRSVRALVRNGRPRDCLVRGGVEIVEGDLRDEKSLRQACRGVTALVHCAARTGHWSKQNHEQRHVNVEGTSALYRAAHDHGIARIVHVSSIAAIGATRDGSVLDETATWNLREAGIHYADTKFEAEERARCAAWGGMPVVIVNPGAMFGPRLDGRGPSSSIVNIALGRTRWIPPGGTSVCDVEDVARGCVNALVRGTAGERYILAGHNIAWAELYARIAQVVGVAAPTWRVPPAAVSVLAAGSGMLDYFGLSRPPWTPEIFRAWGWHSFADSSKAKRELGYSVRPLDAILERSCAGSRRGVGAVATA